GADAELDPAMRDAHDRDEAVAEIGLRRRAYADPRSGAGDEVELRPVGVGRVDDGRPPAETALAVEQRDRTKAVLREAPLDLAWLLVRVHVQRQFVRVGVPAQLAEGLGPARAHGVRSDPDGDPLAAKRLEPAQVVGDGVLAEAWAAAPQVAGEEAHERNSRFRGSCRSGPGLVEPEVVELSARRVAVRPQLAIDVDVIAGDLVDGEGLGKLDHPAAPGPEVASRSPAPEGPLERVAMGVHEARDGDRRHRR